jgi:hypothetical protein
MSSRSAWPERLDLVSREERHVYDKQTSKDIGRLSSNLADKTSQNGRLG